MKVLVVTHPEGDYGAAMLWDGLCALLGADNVYDFPAKESYHGTTHYYSLPNIPNGMTSPYEWVRHFPRAYSDTNEIFDLLNSGTFDVVIAESPRYTQKNVFHQLQSAIRKFNIPVAMCDGEDYPQISKEHVNAISPNLILKREMLRSVYGDKCLATVNGIKVFGFRFSAVVPKLDSIVSCATSGGRAFDHDVFMCCGNTHKDRQDVADALFKASNSSWFIEISPDYNRSRNDGALLPWEKYVEKMFRSRVIVAPRGFGWDTGRAFDAAYLSIPALQNSPIVYPYPYVDGETAILWDTPDECVTKIKQWLSKGADEQHALRMNAKNHTAVNHSTVARAEQLISVLYGVVGKESPPCVSRDWYGEINGR